ncbi:hypothetical protein FTO68_07225 [Methanocalculus taiwanensis]|uniref:Uncharacterized protein n=1 Tax=Methanocalculus taiwanensis TaxID=106207 RepID=A0ABD4TIK9_9EURY|nr:hypothetical protein [Methanocalculus taiwanensis]MCQ1538774.1 hypothetical protein [Methanocalculus taiwanensis]
MLAAPLLFIPVLLRKSPILSVGDRSREPLDWARVQSARLLGFSVVMVAIASGGLGAFVLLMPVWAALVGLGIYGCLIRIGKSRRVR